MSLSYLVFVEDCTWSEQSQKFSLVFGVNCTCMTSYVIVLYGFSNIPHLVRSVLTVQFRFLCRPHLCNQSNRCLVWLSSQIVPGKIGSDNSVLAFRPHWYNHHIIVLFFFVIDYTWSYQSWQLSIIFSIDISYTTGHVIVLFGFHDSLHLIRLVMITQFFFQHRLHLYDRSHHCLVWFFHIPHPIQLVPTI